MAAISAFIEDMSVVMACNIFITSARVGSVMVGGGGEVYWGNGGWWWVAAASEEEVEEVDEDRLVCDTRLSRAL